MTEPSPCPHGKCSYCPTGENAPQSYTGFEPAALRGKRSDFDPFIQVRDRLSQLHLVGHNVEKTELIIMGGTFPARTLNYQRLFVKRCFDAMNSFGKAKKIISKDLKDAQDFNERAIARNVGVTFETRPDFGKEKHVDFMLELGATRVELGVQTLSEEVYNRVNRGHALGDVIDSTRIIKDSGLKVGYHMMPGLFSRPQEDLQMFEKLFSNPDFKPDMLKIYPTLVLEGTELYKLWKQGGFEPPTAEECIDLIVNVKKRLPKWVRTMRIQRDIPAPLIAAGVKKGNLGELVQERLDEEGFKCRCIRCRDAGHMAYKKGVNASNLEVMVEKYPSSGGREWFISMEDKENDLLSGYLRMRFPSSKAHRWEVESGTALIRELKILGEALKIGERSSIDEQHHGMGRALLYKAEEIAVEKGISQLLVKSAVGTKGYYLKLGYSELGPYMAKTL
jgi:elongator complex protein 3